MKGKAGQSSKEFSVKATKGPIRRPAPPPAAVRKITPTCGAGCRCSEIPASDSGNDVAYSKTPSTGEQTRPYSPIEHVLDELARALEMHEDAITTLSEGLKLVTNERAIAVGGETRADDYADPSPLYSKLRHMQVRINNQTDRINHLYEHLDCK